VGVAIGLPPTSLEEKRDRLWQTAELFESPAEGPGDVFQIVH
jgi:hypothetical protein